LSAAQSSRDGALAQALAAHQAQVGLGVALSAKEKERIENRYRVDEQAVLRTLPLVQLIINNEALQRALYELLLCLVACPDSAASVRAIRLLQRLHPALLAMPSTNTQPPHPQQPPPTIPPPPRPSALAVSLHERVFEQGVRVLATGKAQLLDVVEGELVPLSKDLYMALVLTELSAAPRTLLLSLPPAAGASGGAASVAADVAALEDSLRTIAAEKKHRGAMRLFFDRHVKATRVAMQQGGAAGQQANPLDLVGPSKAAASTVRDLEPLNVPARAPKQGGEDISGVANLFG